MLLAHNFYRSSAPSGEDEVVRSEQRLLLDNGIEVTPFTRHNDDLGAGMAGAIGASLSNAWSFDALRELRRLIADCKPDVAHFHNTFPQISPAAYLACREARVPVVQTLHNYRMFCANGLLNRAGEACELCVGRAPLPALVHGCYRESRVATALLRMGCRRVAAIAASTEANHRARQLPHRHSTAFQRGNLKPFIPPAPAPAPAPTRSAH